MDNGYIYPGLFFFWSKQTQHEYVIWCQMTVKDDNIQGCFIVCGAATNNLLNSGLNNLIF